MGEVLRIDDLKKELASLQSFIYFDENNFLREKCSDEDALQKIIEEFEKAILDLYSQSPLEDLLFFHGTIGNLYRIKEEVKSAIKDISKAVELSEGICI